MFEMIGHVRLLKNLNKLTARKQDKLLRQAVLAGARVVVKAIKREIPSRWKAGKKAIGASAKKDSDNGTLIGKAGVGVGIKGKRRAKVIAEHKFNRRGKKKGVGLSVANLHWFLMGTEDRFTGTKKQTRTNNGVKTVSMRSTGNPRKFTGRLKKTPIVKRAFRNSKREARVAMINNLKKGVEREIAKQ